MVELPRTAVPQARPRLGIGSPKDFSIATKNRDIMKIPSKFIGNEKETQRAIDEHISMCTSECAYAKTNELCTDHMS